MKANDNEPAKNVEEHHITIKQSKGKPEDVPVSIEFTKRRQLDAVLDLLDGFTPKEVRKIVRIYKRNRKTDKLAHQNSTTRQEIIGQ